jgi:hypothetical protein
MVEMTGIEPAACRLQGGCSPAELHGPSISLRLCSSASAVPRCDVLSLRERRRPCAAHSGRPCTSRNACPTVVPEHTRNEMSGADTGHRTRGLGHGVAALCLLSYIRLGSELALHPVVQAGPRQLVKERSASANAKAVHPCGTRR